MAQQTINVGTSPNDGLGDPIRTAYIKCNDNFGELYSRAQVDPPVTTAGTVGDSAGMYAYDSSYFYYCFADYDGSSTIWGSIQNIGNASSYIQNGGSNVSIATANAPVTISVFGTSNVAVFYSTGANINGYFKASGNIRTDSLISAAGNITGNNVTATSAVSLPVYANTTVRDSTISSPTEGMLCYVTGTGMQVYGSTQWNTVSGTGT